MAPAAGGAHTRCCARAARPPCAVAPEHARSTTVTAVALPAALKGDDIVKGVAKRGFVIGGGYGKLKSSTFRIGHMGDHTPDRLALCLDATADTIRELLK